MDYSMSSDVSVEFSYDGLAEEIICGGEDLYIDKYGKLSESSDVEGIEHNNDSETTDSVHKDQIGEYNRNEECNVRKDSKEESNEDQESLEEASTIRTDQLQYGTCGSRGASPARASNKEAYVIGQKEEEPWDDTSSTKENETTNNL